MIKTIIINREDDDVSVTYLSDTGNCVEETVFENNAVVLGTSIRAIIICDAIKAALRRRVKELAALGADDRNTELAWIAEDVAGAGEGEDFSEVLEHTHATFDELNKE